MSGASDNFSSAVFLVIAAAQARAWPYNVLIVQDQALVFLRRPAGELVASFGAYKLGGNQIAGWFNLETNEQLQRVRANPESMLHAVAAASADQEEALAVIDSLFRKEHEGSHHNIARI